MATAIPAVINPAKVNTDPNWVANVMITMITTAVQITIRRISRA